MWHTALLDAKFDAFLLRIDEDLAAEMRARGCCRRGRKKAPKKTAAPKRLKKRFKVDGLVKREGNSFDHTKAVHNLLMAVWTDRLMMSSDRARALSTALGIAFSCGLVTTLCGLTFGRQVLITNKGIDFLNWSLGPSAQKALHTKKKRAVHGGDVAGAIQDYQPNNNH
jgi:hypothetical protein